MSVTKLRQAWGDMHRRCYDATNKDFHNYGGRGIVVCERWHNVDNFINDMQPTWRLGLTLDRRNVDGNYEPDNCKWATRAEQAKNRRSTKLLPEQVQEIKQLERKGYQQSKIAEMFNISRAMVCMIVNGQRRAS